VSATTDTLALLHCNALLHNTAFPLQAVGGTECELYPSDEYWNTGLVLSAAHTAKEFADTDVEHQPSCCSYSSSSVTSTATTHVSSNGDAMEQAARRRARLQKRCVTKAACKTVVQPFG
jgi:hypothetical protein